MSSTHTMSEKSKLAEAIVSVIKTPHEIVLEGAVLVPEEGLLLGNGDLSVSVYQGADEIRFRIGKGDVWDRRLDFSKDPRPAHISEVTKGIEEEGWVCGAYGGPVEATKGEASDPERMREICGGCPPSYNQYPFPCPKPVGELVLRLCGDLPGLTITQRLIIEEARIEVVCLWANGVRLEVTACIDPAENRLALAWRLEGWEESQRFGGRFEGIPEAYPIWFSLYRLADPKVGDFARKHFSTSRHPGFLGYEEGGAEPLPAPVVIEDGSVPAVVQLFPDDTLFEGGFACAMAAIGPGLSARVADSSNACAGVHLLPKGDCLTGEICVGVATTGDVDPRGKGIDLGKPEAERAVELAGSLGFKPIREATAEAAARFWSSSQIRLGDPSLEKLWYATLHAKRCILRRGKTAPGLFLPSTVRDYGLWHGDYHTNYNLQSIFLGDFESNHLELGDAYFEAISYFLEIGRKIARDYYGCRGAFIQLSGYATHPTDDPIGTAPMGRMAYMTGWASNMFWWRYQFSMDKDWLASTGYPALRDCALFYTDFLGRGEDGLFHAFPSNQGEDGFSGNSVDFRDRPQIMRHARYCLRNAVKAAEALGIDPDYTSQWKEILKHLAPEDGDPKKTEALYPDDRAELLAPEFYAFDGGLLPCDTKEGEAPAYLNPEHDSYRWYPGKLPFQIIQSLRNGIFRPERDFGPTSALLERWTHANGLLWAMAIANYGRVGGWTESLGISGALQEMLLQSWSGVIEMFPSWPGQLDASFESFRAEGAFLVSAALSGGEISDVSIISEKGATCRLRNPWPQRSLTILSSDGNHFAPESAGADVIFQTAAGCSYKVMPSSI